ncbi:hypothetical protein TSO221_30110, partial [Azospirillum sp. TSO22-1]
MTDPKTDAAPEADKPTVAEAGSSSIESGERATPLRAPSPLSDPPPAAPARPPRARGGGWAT